MTYPAGEKHSEKHSQALPTLRKIRRACNRELYRTAKRLKLWVPPDRMAEAEELYLKKVVQHLTYIAENGSNRKLLSDWWDEHVRDDIAKLWNVDADDLSRAFRDAFGG
ncbi:dehydrogenase [Paenibacillus flagellatus]|uniref:Dehydrogenase n=1 Tax=Paenibacillus flagellatus TaxID=2211139 RepID=A0A2V5KCI1_9BACL|nr:dehydrogenase [Paenibacillus flagellatus]PYI51600.1 dehydrogenase [Paenibacillus flagellatus]